jgi:hypothetical protein
MFRDQLNPNEGGSMLKVAARIACLLILPWLPLPALAQESTLQVGVGSGDVSTLDPHRASATGDMTPVGWIYNALVRFKPGSADPRDLEPDLAESWDVSADGKTWTFHLRKGVKFQGDWGELTADDVVYSLHRSADPKRSTFTSDFASVENVAKLDDDTVRVTLKYPDVNFLGRVSNYHGGNIVSQKAAEKFGDDFGHHPVGTGPFAFVEQVTQQYVKLAANQAYFRGKPKIDTIILRNIPSDSARELAFSSGELDLMDGKREQRWVDSARRRQGFHVDIFQPGEYRLLHINQTIPPLDDLRVREAIAAAVNVDDLVRYVGKDVGPKGCSIVPPGYLGEDCRGGRLRLRSRQGQGVSRRGRPCRWDHPQGDRLEHLGPATHHGGHPVAVGQGRDQAGDADRRSSDLSKSDPQGCQRARLLWRRAVPGRRYVSQRVFPFESHRRHADRREQLLPLRGRRPRDRGGARCVRRRDARGHVEGGAAKDHGGCLRRTAVRAAAGLGP